MNGLVRWPATAVVARKQTRRTSIWDFDLEVNEMVIRRAHCLLSVVLLSGVFLPAIAAVDILLHYAVEDGDDQRYDLTAPSSKGPYLNSSGGDVIYCGSWSEKSAGESALQNTISLGQYSFSENAIDSEAFIAVRLSAPGSSGGKWDLFIQRTSFVSAIPSYGYVYVTLSVANTYEPADVVIHSGGKSMSPMTRIFVLAINEESGVVENMVNVGSSSPHIGFHDDAVIMEFVPPGAGGRVYLSKLSDALAELAGPLPLPDACTSGSQSREFLYGALGTNSYVYICGKDIVVINVETLTQVISVTVSSTSLLSPSFSNVQLIPQTGGSLVGTFAFSSNVNFSSPAFGWKSLSSDDAFANGIFMINSDKSLAFVSVAGTSLPNVFPFRQSNVVVVVGSASSSVTFLGQTLTLGSGGGMYIWTFDASDPKPSTVVLSYFGDGQYAKGIAGISVMKDSLAFISSCSSSFSFNGATVDCQPPPAALQATAMSVFVTVIGSHGKPLFTPTPFLSTQQLSFVELSPPNPTTVEEQRQTYQVDFPDFVGMTGPFYGEVTIYSGSPAVSAPEAVATSMELYALIDSKGQCQYIKSTNSSVWASIQPVLFYNGDTLFTLSPRLSSYSQLVKDYTVDFGGVSVEFDLSFCVNDSSQCAPLTVLGVLYPASALVTVSSSGQTLKVVSLAVRGALTPSLVGSNAEQVVLPSTIFTIGAITTGVPDFVTKSGSFAMDISTSTAANAYSSFSQPSTLGQGLNFSSIYVDVAAPATPSVIAYGAFITTADGQPTALRTAAASSSSASVSFSVTSSAVVLPGGVVAVEGSYCGDLNVGDANLKGVLHSVTSPPSTPTCKKNGETYDWMPFIWGLGESGETAMITQLNGAAHKFFGITGLYASPAFLATTSYETVDQRTWISVFPVSSTLAPTTLTWVVAVGTVGGALIVGAVVAIAVVSAKRKKKQAGEPLLDNA